MIHDMTNLTDRLRRAIDIAAQIEELQSEMNALLNIDAGPTVSTARRLGRPPNITVLPPAVHEQPKPRKRRKFTREGRERMRAAQNRRWAKFHAEKSKRDKAA